MWVLVREACEVVQVGKRHLSSAEAIENNAESEDVTGLDSLAEKLFGGHVEGCTTLWKSMVGSGGGDRHAEITQDNKIFFIESTFKEDI